MQVPLLNTTKVMFVCVFLCVCKSVFRTVKRKSFPSLCCQLKKELKNVKNL